jgi:hypothetical protein
VRGTLSCVCLLVLTGTLVAGCTAKSHPNDPRPPVDQVISVSVSDDAIEVAPRGIGLPGQVPVNLNQNRNAPISQADRAAPAVVDFRVSNLLRRRARLTLEGPVDREFDMTPASPGSFTAGLEPGIYRLSSPGSAGTARFIVGSSRISSSSDLLTP